MKALSIRQPWAYAVLMLGKNVENRTWRTEFRGRVLIHAGLKTDFANWRVPPGTGLPLDVLGGPDVAAHPAFTTGAIVGEVEIFAVDGGYKSPWGAEGQWKWVLKNPYWLKKPVPCKGRLGFWKVPTDIVKAGRLRDGDAWVYP